MAEFLYRLGRGSARHARKIIAAWFAVLLAVGIAFAIGGGTLSNAMSIPGTPTAEVTDRLAREFPEASGGTGSIVAQTSSGEAFTAEQEQAIGAIVTEAKGIDGIETVIDPFATESDRSDQAAAIKDAQQQIADAKDKLKTGSTQLQTAEEELAAGREQLDKAIAQARSAGLYDQAKAQFDNQSAQLNAVAEELKTQRAKLDEGSATLEKQEAELQQGASLLNMAAEIRTVSADGRAAITTVVFTEAQMDIAQETKDALVAAFAENPVAGVEFDFSSEVSQGIPSVFGVGEVIGLIVAGIVLVVMLGTLVGAGLPLLTALVGVAIGALGAMSLSSVLEMSSVTPMLGLMLGLAVGIDYSLFIINRHRHQLKDGYTVRESIALANGTSGNAVVFAGATVFIALLALNVTRIPFLGLMGSVGAASVLIAVLVAITLTPALLSLVGQKILSRKERARLEAGPQVSAAVTSRVRAVRPMSTKGAIGAAVGSIALLLVIAIPALDLRLNLPDGSSEASDTTQYRAYTSISERFGEGQNGPLLVVADLPGTPSEEQALAYQRDIAETIFAQDDVVAVAPAGTSADRSVAAFQVIPEQGPTSVSTEELVHTLRGLSPVDGTFEIGVAGSASGNVDISEKLAEALPIYLVVVVGLSMLILILVFRSIFVPLVATIGFILSYFASLGGVVAIYQWGWFSTIFGVDTPGPILNFLPTLLVGILFGLAMDYQLFIGSGMREAYAHGAQARLAVVQGVRAGRAVVSAAAIIMISVFGGFVFSHSAMIRPIGFALAFGVLVDAFVVRMLLIPALMHLAGDKAWWLPKWLNRILPDIDVEGASLERSHPHVAPTLDANSAQESARHDRS
ncbi:MMPL family transporter [Glutamicibacter sp.]|uniref:MMPL family transporter n=1 Tax=Glutamicibacter sp. TaxID=1931995 RepID=UPI002B484F5F|nr:MMPL family transporter [Glutamicibacter sp.]HJX78643.1 MMPL family transporter [Glutamicibacter sp.]